MSGLRLGRDPVAIFLLQTTLGGFRPVAGISARLLKYHHRDPGSDWISFKPD
jgi:hypothetical protein